MRHVLLTDRAPGATFEVTWTRGQRVRRRLAQWCWVAAGLCFWLGLRLTPTTPRIRTFTRPAGGRA